jgi:hypothetical protein
MKTSGAGHPRPLLGIEIWRIKQKKIPGYFTHGNPRPFHPTQPLCHFPYLSHKFWDKQWQVSLGLGQCWQKENQGTHWNVAWCPKLLMRREDSQDSSRACPGDCLGTKGQGQWSFWG